ncbi:hypothetical protein H5410_015542 [Solanum commersonii]|uniref:Uncharacterized protein n=1 Tax=Solanum commersonii TaxID=4109 RepID=A0A9J5ZTZ5_SOLCO|nr:hypothetical protein H5410_015542 [Solanum commersonii]
MLNDIFGTVDDTYPLVLKGLNIHPPYQAFRHTLYGPQSMGGSGLIEDHHKLLDSWVALLGITRDKVCLVYALMTNTELNIGAVLKSAMRKARVHRGKRYAFGGLITHFCRSVVDITKRNGHDNEFGSTLIIAESHQCDEMIMDHMYGIEMLRYMNGCWDLTTEPLREVDNRYPLNALEKAILDIGPKNFELMD